jgi:hypothetical protein
LNPVPVRHPQRASPINRKRRQHNLNIITGTARLAHCQWHSGVSLTRRLVVVPVALAGSGWQRLLRCVCLPEWTCYAGASGSESVASSCMVCSAAAARLPVSHWQYLVRRCHWHWHWQRTSTDSRTRTRASKCLLRYYSATAVAVAVQWLFFYLKFLLTLRSQALVVDSA